jgi:hypothetical protein
LRKLNSKVKYFKKDILKLKVTETNRVWDALSSSGDFGSNYS